MSLAHFGFALTIAHIANPADPPANFSMSHLSFCPYVFCHVPSPAEMIPHCTERPLFAFPVKIVFPKMELFVTLTNCKLVTTAMIRK